MLQQPSDRTDEDSRSHLDLFDDRHIEEADMVDRQFRAAPLASCGPAAAPIHLAVHATPNERQHLAIVAADKALHDERVELETRLAHPVACVINPWAPSPRDLLELGRRWNG